MPNPCKTCRWHVRYENHSAGIADGVCHRYPTTVPKYDADFCGEHEPKVEAEEADHG
jgi:hypothetical protein